MPVDGHRVQGGGGGGGGGDGGAGEGRQVGRWVDLLAHPDEPVVPPGALAGLNGDNLVRERVRDFKSSSSRYCKGASHARSNPN